MPVWNKQAAGEAIECAVAASRYLGVPAADIAGLRSAVAAAYPETLNAGTLKQADEQSLTALLAVRQALDAAGLTPTDCEAWGLVAAPRTPGRKRIAESIARFREQGAWSVSPHVIPHCSLHSLSGLLSQALKLHGPNLGSAGTRGAEAEALWSALALLEGERLPGVWVVFTGWDRESTSCEGATCLTAVAGLRPASLRSTLPRLQFNPVSGAARQRFTLESFGVALEAGRTASWDFGGAVGTFSPGAIKLEAAA